MVARMLSWPRRHGRNTCSAIGASSWIRCTANSRARLCAPTVSEHLLRLIHSAFCRFLYPRTANGICGYERGWVICLPPLCDTCCVGTVRGSVLSRHTTHRLHGFQIFVFSTPLDASEQPRPLLYVVRVPRASKILDVRRALAVLCHVSSDRLLMTEVYDGEIVQLYHDSQPTSRMKDSDMVVAYIRPPSMEIDSSDSEDADEKVAAPDARCTVIIMHRKLDPMQLRFGIQAPKFMGVPVVISCSEDTTTAEYDLRSFV